MKIENQKLKDENNRLKVEQGKPDIKPNKKDGDISSENEQGHHEYEYIQFVLAKVIEFKFLILPGKSDVVLKKMVLFSGS